MGSYKVNINSLISDQRVWRVISNGYPYKKLDGLTDHEAYFATKQAIYCALGYRTASQYTGIGGHGDTIVSTIAKLENIGKTGTETKDNYTLYLTKSARKDTGDYYSQTFIINSERDVSEYEVTKLTGFPSGTYICDVNGVKKTKFNSGTEYFNVMIPKSNITEDINGTVTIVGKVANCPILYGATTVDGSQNYALAYDKYEDTVGTGTFTLRVNTGKIEVTKLDAENSNPIEGVEFQLIAEDGSQIGTAKTNSEGIATFSKLYPGEYKLREISTTDSYILNSELSTVKVVFNETTTCNVTNYPKKGNLNINKTDMDTAEPVSGVTFQLLDLDNNVVATGTTDEKGELTFPDLRIGKYKLKETETNPNYVLNTEVFDVNIEYDKTTVKDITNEYKKGNIKINKTDSETSQGIEGVTFQLFDLEGNIVATATTNEVGEAYFNDIRIGKYRLKEAKTTPDYILNTEVFDVEVEYNKTITKDITNEHKRGNLVVNKVDKDNNKIALGNIIFDLFSNEFDKIVGTYTTDVDGQFTIYGLRTGTYHLIERTTGQWYNLAEDTEVQIAWNETTETIIENELKKSQIKVIKVDKDNNEIKLEGVEFEILDENDNVLEKIITDENGEAITSNYSIRDYSNLKIRESKTLENYQLSDEVKIVELKEDEISTIVFENEKIPEIHNEIVPDVPEEKVPETPSIKVEKKLPKTGF